MNFPFHEFKHLIDQNNNINSNNRSFNKTQRVKSIQEGPTEKFKTIKIVSITSRSNATHKFSAKSTYACRI